MLIQWHCLMILLFLLSSSSSSETESRWILEAELQYYINPTSRDDKGQCCNSTTTPSSPHSQCPSPCSNIFTFRLHQPYANMHTVVLNRTYGTYDTGLVTGGDNLTFTDGEPIGENNVSNPLIFNGTQWPTNDWLYFGTDITYKTTDGGSSFVITLEKSLYPMSNGWSYNITLSGTIPNSTSVRLQVWFNMRCDQHYYGHQCGIFCQSRNDSTGHYTCDSDGNRVCTTGYHMIESNCTTPICDDPVCNSTHQQCVSPNSCECRDGWTGTTCDIDTTDNTTNSTSTDTTITSTTNSTNTDTTITSTTNTITTNTTNDNSTTIAILGAVAALLVITTILITFLTLFAVCKKRSSRTKKGQDKENITHGLDNPIYSTNTTVADNTAEEPRTHLATNNHRQESSGDDLKRLFDSPIYAEPLKQETNTPNSHTRAPISQYSLVADVNELDEVLPCYPGASYLELLKGSDNAACSKPFQSVPTRAVGMSSEMPEIDVVEYADI